MDKDDVIIRLLTEIRDNQRKEIAWRRKAVKESVRLQRIAVRRQAFGLAIVGLVIVGSAIVVTLLLLH
jgi:hypothetical protein